MSLLLKNIKKTSGHPEVVAFPPKGHCG